MIRIIIGNVGAGKTLTIIRELIVNNDNRKTFSNIKTKGIKNNFIIDPSMIFIKEIKKVKRSGEIEYDLKFNRKFWEDTIKKEKSINVVLDEAHTLINSRRAMSSKNKVMGDFMALLRRILGANESGYGQLTLITQLPKRLDPIARDMATSIWYCTLFYDKSCKKCGFTFNESNEVPESKFSCPRCNSNKLTIHNHIMQVFKFKGMAEYEYWKMFNKKTYYDKYYLTNLEKYFPRYNTLQWDNLLEEF